MKRTRVPQMLTIDAVGGLCTAAIVSAVVLLAAMPAIAQNRERADHEDRLIAIKSETELAVSALRETRTRLRRGEIEAQQLPDHLRESNDLNHRIAQIIDETDAYGLAVLAIVPSEPERHNRFSRTPIELSTRGPIDAIARYLHAMHTSAPDLELTKLEIREPDEAGVLNAVIRADWITLAQ